MKIEIGNIVKSKYKVYSGYTFRVVGFSSKKPTSMPRMKTLELIVVSQPSCEPFLFQHWPIGKKIPNATHWIRDYEVCK